MILAVRARAGIRAAAVDDDGAAVAARLREVILRQQHRRRFRQVRREDAGGAGMASDTSSDEVEPAGRLDAAGHTCGTETSRRGDAALDRPKRHVWLERGGGHAGIASVRSGSTLIGRSANRLVVVERVP